MPVDPKTPKRSRNETRAPLTPSLTNGVNNVSISTDPIQSKPRRAVSKHKSKPIKKASKSNLADVTNPFISTPETATEPVTTQRRNPRSQSISKSTSYDFKAALNLGGGRSRPSSPTRTRTRKLTESGTFVVTDALRKEASMGVISLKDAQSQFDILKRKDYTPPPRAKMTRSQSQPAIGRRDRTYSHSRERPYIDRAHTDRFITNRAEQDLCATLELMHLNVNSASPGHTKRLAEAAGVPINKRVLAFHEVPPMAARPDPMLSEQREHVKPLLASAGSSSAGQSSGVSSKPRKISTQPERVLDAPGMVDDFYLNLISWSSQNVVAVALGESTYTWRADTGSVLHLGDVSDGAYVSSVEFSADGSFLAVGTGSGDVELWDTETGSRLRIMTGHTAQIPALAWNGHVLSSGCGDGSIWHHDVRIARHKVMELIGHHGEICGLKWRSDGEYLASGGNDNLVNIWDARLEQSLLNANDESNEIEVRTQPKFAKRNHTAAVKALAWCPWQSNLLATGGGTNDATINFWNSSMGARVQSLKTPAQITSLHFAPHKKEIFSTHGYPDNALMVHSYPTLNKVAEIKEAHDARVLFSCVGPAGDLVLTGAGDENLKFWRIWEVPKKERLHKKAAGLGISSKGLGIR